MQSHKKSGRERTTQLVITALMIALVFIFSRFLGINTDVIHLGFDFLPIVVIACLYGPIWAAFTGIIGDLVCAIGMPIGVLNPGITLIAGLIGFIYGIVFYGRELNRREIIICSAVSGLIVSGIVKLFGTTACLALTYGSPYWPTLISRIPNCAILFLIQLITIPLIIRYVVIPVRSKISI